MLKIGIKRKLKLQRIMQQFPAIRQPESLIFVEETKEVDIGKTNAKRKV